MMLSFTLSMPSRNSWNGRWSGDERIYARVFSFAPTKKAQEKVKQILEKGSFYYNFGDGWTARIDVKEVDRKEAARIRRKSNGFCGYDWMIESIKLYQEIRPEKV